MIIVDSKNEIWDFFESTSLKDKLSAARLNLDAFELANGFEHEIVIAHTDILKSEVAKAKLRNTFSVVFYGDDSCNYQELSNAVFFLSSKSDQDLFVNLVTKMDSLSREQQVFKSQMLTINSDLSEVMGSVEVELLKIKKLYETKAPKRFQDFKGVQLFSKYSAGENIGGEFFDIHKVGSKLLIMMSSTSSYLVSSSILNLFSTVKETSHVDNDVTNELFKDICSDARKINASKSKKVTLELCILNVDLNSLKVQGKIFGNFHLKTSDLEDLYTFKHKDRSFDELDEEEFNFESKLKRGQRLLISSPGFNKNWQKLSPEFLQEQLLANDSIKTLDILDEAFFQLKKNLKGGFLSYDASAIILEVDQNAIFKA